VCVATACVCVLASLSFASKHEWPLGVISIIFMEKGERVKINWKAKRVFVPFMITVLFRGKA